MDDVVEIEIPPSNEQSPGALISHHLVPIKGRMLPPGEASFYAFGATIATGSPGQITSVQSGQAYIHLYSSSCDEVRNLPQPPSDRQALNARFYSLGLEEPPEDVAEEVIRLPARREILISKPVLPLNPQAPTFAPRNPYLADNEDKMTVQEKEAARTLISLGHSYKTRSIPVYNETRENDNWPRHIRRQGRGRDS